MVAKSKNCERLHANGLCLKISHIHFFKNSSEKNIGFLAYILAILIYFIVTYSLVLSIVLIFKEYLKTHSEKNYFEVR